MAVCFLTNPKADVLAEEDAEHDSIQLVSMEEERNDNDIQVVGADDRENHDDGDEIPYEYVCFILPTEEAYWAEPINMNSAGDY